MKGIEKEEVLAALASYKQFLESKLEDLSVYHQAYVKLLITGLEKEENLAKKGEITDYAKNLVKKVRESNNQ